jgi:hypothetical protein
MLSAERCEGESRQPCIVVLAELEVRGRHVVFQLAHAGCTRDRNHVGFADEPRESDLGVSRC